MNSEVLVSLITIDYNSADHTAALIESLSLSIYQNWELIIVDNGTNSEAEARFKSLGKENISYIKPAKNLGFAGGNNVGIEQSKGEYVFFVNNDTEITPKLLGQLVSRFSDIPDLGIISPKIIFHNSNIIQYAGYTPLDWRMRNRAIGNKQEDSKDFQLLLPTFSAHGAAMMTRKSVIDKVGRMPELYFLYYEEMDWCQMITQCGYQVCVDQESFIYHKESMSIGKANPLKVYYLTRNRILYSKRNQAWKDRFSFWIYSYFIVFPAKAILYTLKGEVKYAKELLKAHLWNLTHKSHS